MILSPLSADDLRLASYMGQGRNGIKVTAGIPSRRFDPLSSDTRAHILGAMGEIAVARFFGVEPDTAFTLTGDGGTDLVLNDVTWDVKTRGEMNTDLLIYPDMRDFKAHYCMLCWLVKPGVIGIVGYVERVRFKRRSILLTRPARLCMRWQDLTQIMQDRG